MDFYYDGDYAIEFYSRENEDSSDLLEYYEGSMFGDDAYGTLLEYATLTGRKKKYYRHTWKDWKLIPSAKPVIAVPGVSSKFVEIPGRSGALDLTNYLTGKREFKNRTGNLDFILTQSPEQNETILADIQDFFNNKNNIEMYLTSEPKYYYKGHFEVASISHTGQYTTVSISYNLDPYKYGNIATSGEKPGNNCVEIDFNVSYYGQDVTGSTPPDDVWYNIYPEGPYVGEYEQPTERGGIIHRQATQMPWKQNRWYNNNYRRIIFGYRAPTGTIPAPIIFVSSSQVGGKTVLHYRGGNNSYDITTRTHYHTYENVEDGIVFNSAEMYDIGPVRGMDHMEITGDTTHVTVIYRGVTLF